MIITILIVFNQYFLSTFSVPGIAFMLRGCTENWNPLRVLIVSE